MAVQLSEHHKYAGMIGWLESATVASLHFILPWSNCCGISLRMMTDKKVVPCEVLCTGANRIFSALTLVHRYDHQGIIPLAPARTTWPSQNLLD
jgi:hypothetical protein